MHEVLGAVSVLYLCEAAFLISEINIQSWNRWPLSVPLDAILLDMEPLIEDCYKCDHKHHWVLKFLL